MTLKDIYTITESLHLPTHTLHLQEAGKDKGAER